MLTTDRAFGRPEPGEAAPYYFGYIDKVPSDDVLGVLDAQLDETLAFLSGISEERSFYRYAPGDRCLTTATDRQSQERHLRHATRSVFRQDTLDGCNNHRVMIADDRVHRLATETIS